MFALRLLLLIALILLSLLAAALMALLRVPASLSRWLRLLGNELDVRTVEEARELPLVKVTGDCQDYRERR